jgi:subtilisin family serine protease
MLASDAIALDDRVFVQLSGDRKAFVQSLRDDAALEQAIDPNATLSMLRSRGRTLLSVPLRTGASPTAVKALLDTMPGVKWTSLNYAYTTNAGPEYEPDDPLAAQQYALDLVGAKGAWATTEGNGVVVAITDEGFAYNHPDLAPNVWVNADEIAGNGIDDDNNGYIDDLNGWDFTGNDADVSSSGGSHGTHVAGIVAARTNNATGVAGIAGRAKLMLLRTWNGSITTQRYFDSFRYAVDNGAKVLTNSLGIDGFVNDSVFLAAFQYAYDNGVLVFNSAGNEARNNPERVALDTTLLVANTDANDVRNFTSNYGTGIDFAAPGTSILSTIGTNASPNYGYMSGTSMASPAAAAVAAIVWAANPTFTRDQVAARMVATATRIDTQNPAVAGLLGAGRVNAASGVGTTGIAPPTLRSIVGLPAQNGRVPQASAPTSFTVRLASVLDPTSATTPTNYRLTEAGIDEQFGTPDDVSIPISRTTGTVRYARNEIVFSIDAPLTSGYYRFTAGASIVDPFGQALDGNADGTGGDDYTRDFVVTPSTPRADFNRDGFVNFDDLLILAAHYNASSLTFTAGDADYDGDADFDDLILLASQYNT